MEWHGADHSVTGNGMLVRYCERVHAPGAAVCLSAVAAFAAAVLHFSRRRICRRCRLPRLAILPLGLAIFADRITRLAVGSGWICRWSVCRSVKGLSEGWSSQLADRVDFDSALISTPASGVLMFHRLPVNRSVLPYMAGKLLIEGQDAQGETMRRKVVTWHGTLLAIVCGDQRPRLSVWAPASGSNGGQRLVSPAVCALGRRRCAGDLGALPAHSGTPFWPAWFF